jgi:hypothetical protein
MVRISKQAERRSQSPRRPKPPAQKTGPLKDNLPQGYKPQPNALAGDMAAASFIPKIK